MPSASGQYVYCVVDDVGGVDIGEVGLLKGNVSAVPYRDIAAVVSPVPFQELESNIANIMAHEKVVELARAKHTTLPVRFGVIFKSAEGVKQLLSKSYDDYKAKLKKLAGKDEYGVKLILSSQGMVKLTQKVGKSSEELGKLAKASVRASKGTAYLLKLKADEALKAESLRRLDEVSGKANEQLSAAAVDHARLKSDHEQIVLNAAYLVERQSSQAFRRAVDGLAKELKSLGLEVHMSGPWAPYSFC
jgi:hypothetical protein